MTTTTTLTTHHHHHDHYHNPHHPPSLLQVKNVRMQLRERDRTIASFKRELTLLVESTGDREALLSMVDSTTTKFLGIREKNERVAEVAWLAGAPRALSTDETADELKQVIKISIKIMLPKMFSKMTSC